MTEASWMLCHGSPEDFGEFDLERVKDGRTFGRGFYFSNSVGLGRQYSDGRDPIVARVTLANPYVVDRDAPFEEVLARSRVFRPNRDARERLIAAGHDGVVVMQGGYLEVVAFHASQIRSYGRRPDLSDPEAPMPETAEPEAAEAPAPGM